MSRLLTSMVFALAALEATALAAPVPSTTPSPNVAMMDRAKEFFHRIATGDIDRSELTPQMNDALTNAMIKQVAAQVAPLGDPTSFQQVQSGRQGGSEYYIYVVTFPSGDRWNYLFVYDPVAKKISGLRITPAP